MSMIIAKIFIYNRILFITYCIALEFDLSSFQLCYANALPTELNVISVGGALVKVGSVLVNIIHSLNVIYVKSEQSGRPKSIFLITLHFMKHCIYHLHLVYSTHSFIQNFVTMKYQNFFLEVLLFHTIKPYSIRSLTLHLMFFPPKALLVRKS